MPKPGKGKTVLLDTYFNNEWKKDATGTMVRYHYTWDDKANSGFSMLGDIFERHGAQKKSLEEAPTAANLKNAHIYIIVDPDTNKETEKPNVIQPEHVNVISDWVRSGGVLVLMGNDAGNAEFEHFNKLAAPFGIYFREESKNRVQNDNYPEGTVTAPACNFGAIVAAFLGAAIADFKSPRFVYRAASRSKLARSM